MKKTFLLGVLAVVTLFVNGTLMAQTVSKDPITIKWYGTNAAKPGPEAPVPKLLQELLTKKLGYEVKFELGGGKGNDADYEQGLNILYAANDLPDVFWKRTTADEKFNNGATTHFSLDEYKTYMPRSYAYFKATLAKMGQTEAEVLPRYYDEKGQLFGAPRLYDMGGVPYGVMWRQDLLEQFGIKTIPTTLAEVEAAFAAYKVKFPTKYPLHGGFKGLGYQFAEIVFNAFNVERRTNVWITGANGKLIRGQWDPNAKKALAVLADWFKKGYIDPEFYNLANNASSDAWKTGNGLVGAWAGSGDWVATPGSTSLQLMTNVPGAKVVPGPYPKVDKNGPLPLVGVYDPFLYQYTGFGKNLSKNRDQLHKVMQVCDLISNDRETRYLAYYGIEGKHYTIPEGEVATLPTPEYAAKSTAEKIATEGYGGYWDYTLGFVRGNVQLKAIDAAINKFFVDPNGLYGSKNIKLSLAPGAVNKAIEDEQGNDLSKFMASDTSLTWDNYIAPIIIGGKPLSYFDDQYQRYLKQGGEKEELYANKLFGKK